MTNIPLHRITYKRVRELLLASANADKAHQVQILIDESGKSFATGSVDTDIPVTAYDRMTAEHPDLGLIRVYWPRKRPQDHGYATVR
ncbi:hypothetical protein NKJ86_08850 [Mesorhizobium sp. M0025]|uniref:hypothetical protein n=1 Tax=Mesorhizobium sp. M0025 TaxID=2956846 RepID=UPI00333D0F29